VGERGVERRRPDGSEERREGGREGGEAGSKRELESERERTLGEGWRLEVPWARSLVLGRG
jgi:hypothetical protein